VGFDPLASGFNRIAKEDTVSHFFFFMLAIIFLAAVDSAWPKANAERNPERFYSAPPAASAPCSRQIRPDDDRPSRWGTRLCLSRDSPTTRWVIGKNAFLKFFFVMGGRF